MKKDKSEPSVFDVNLDDLIDPKKERLWQTKGTFSGTDECMCGGKVIYTGKRGDGAELGNCNECGGNYIDKNGNRLKLKYDYTLG